METTDDDVVNRLPYVQTARANLARMKLMRLSPDEYEKVAGALSGYPLMEAALDMVEADRRRETARRLAERGPIKGQTVIDVPADDRAVA